MKVWALFSFHEVVTLHSTRESAERARDVRIEREKSAINRLAPSWRADGMSDDDIARECQMIEDDLRVCEMEVLP